MKGIVLAGGSGTRLHPLTQVTSKQLLPVYDKPMIYYPLSVLMLGKIRDILIISTPHDLPNFKRMLGDGSQFGINLSYVEQPSPDGLAQALILGKEFLAGDSCTLILGDNIFFGNGITNILRSAIKRAESGGGATIFGYPVHDPQRFGIVELDGRGEIVSIEEKPDHPKSNLCVTGLYVYDKDAPEYAEQLTPSARGELEITDLNARYLSEGRLHAQVFNRGYTWFDTGTVNSLFHAGEFIRTIQQNQGFQIGNLEEIAYNFGWITAEALRATVDALPNNEYGAYLDRLLRSGR